MIKEAIGSGETLAQAQKNACEILGVSEQDVKFDVIQMPSKKTFGIFGGKQAKVKAIFERVPSKVASEYLARILTAYGVKDFNIDIVETDDGAAFHITGDNAKIAIGKRGDTLDAIQYLVGLVANDVSESYYRVTINIGDYRERREKVLESLGKKIAFKAIKSQKPVVLEPMTPYERKIIHLAVEKVKGAKSWSEGENTNRHIIVAPDEDSKIQKKNFKKNENNNSIQDEIPLYGKI